MFTYYALIITPNNIQEHTFNYKLIKMTTVCLYDRNVETKIYKLQIQLFATI